MTDMWVYGVMGTSVNDGKIYYVRTADQSPESAMKDGPNICVCYSEETVSQIVADHNAAAELSRAKNRIVTLRSAMMVAQTTYGVCESVYEVLEDALKADTWGLLDGSNGAEPGTDTELARVKESRGELANVVDMLLPLAKGYAPEGQTATARASCRRRIEAAEIVLSRYKGDTA